MKCPLCDTRMVADEDDHCPNCGWVLGGPVDGDEADPWVQFDLYDQEKEE